MHNKRIERVWLNVKRFFFLPSINNALRELLKNWNNHPLSSDHNFSPYQLWRLGLNNYQISNPEEFNNLSKNDWESFGIDYKGPLPSEEDDEAIVPEQKFPLTHDQIQCLLEVVNKNREMGKADLYLTILNLLSNFL